MASIITTTMTLLSEAKAWLPKYATAPNMTSSATPMSISLPAAAGKRTTKYSANMTAKVPMSAGCNMPWSVIHSPKKGCMSFVE